MTRETAHPGTQARLAWRTGEVGCGARAWEGEDTGVDEVRWPDWERGDQWLLTLAEVGASDVVLAGLAGWLGRHERVVWEAGTSVHAPEVGDASGERHDSARHARRGDREFSELIIEPAY